MTTFKITAHEDKVQALIEGSGFDIIAMLGTACLTDDRIYELLKQTIHFVDTYNLEQSINLN
jgi:hypothetical protein